MKAANLANSSNISPEIWQPDATPEGLKAALVAKDKKLGPQQGRESISGSGKSASSAALSANRVSGRDTAASALPDAYAWGDRTSSLTSSVLNSATYAHSATTRVNSRPGKSEAPTFNSIPNNRVPDSNYLQNIGGLQQAAKKKADDRLSSIFNSRSLPASRNAAAAAANLSHEEDNVRVARDREVLETALQQQDAIMKVAKSRADKRINDIDEEVFYKNPTLNLKYYTAALAVAEEKGKQRLVNHGKIDIGGGKFMSQSDIDAIAERNVRPVINEITEKAQAQRQADEERRIAEEEERRRKAEADRLLKEQKMAERKEKKDRKLADKAIRDEEKAKQREANAAERAEREKVKRAERETVMAQRQEEQRARDAEKAEIKRQKAIIADRRKAEKSALKEAVAASAAAALLAKEAESKAHGEVQKLNALKLSAETKLEAARLAESQAESEAQAEKARAEATAAQVELAKAEAEAKDAEARRIEAEAEKARAEAEAEKSRENQQLFEERAKAKERELANEEAKVEAEEAEAAEALKKEAGETGPSSNIVSKAIDNDADETDSFESAKVPESAGITVIKDKTGSLEAVEDDSEFKDAASPSEATHKFEPLGAVTEAKSSDTTSDDSKSLGHLEEEKDDEVVKFKSVSAKTPEVTLGGSNPTTAEIVEQKVESPASKPVVVEKSEDLASPEAAVVSSSSSFSDDEKSAALPHSVSVNHGSISEEKPLSAPVDLETTGIQDIETPVSESIETPIAKDTQVPEIETPSVTEDKPLTTDSKISTPSNEVMGDNNAVIAKDSAEIVPEVESPAVPIKTVRADPDDVPIAGEALKSSVADSVASVKSGNAGISPVIDTKMEDTVTDKLDTSKSVEPAVSSTAEVSPVAESKVNAIEPVASETTTSELTTADSVSSKTKKQGKTRKLFNKLKEAVSSDSKPKAESSSASTVKKEGVQSKTTNTGNVSATSAAKAALGTSEPTTSTPATKTTKETVNPLSRTFSGFSQGSAEDLETSTAEKSK